MADIKITEMPAQSALTGDELIPAVDLTRVQALQNRRVEIEQIVPKGGTTGQVLTKTSGTNYATEWATPSVGGGGGDYNVLNIDFAPTEIASNVSSAVVLSTFSMPADSLGPNQQLLIESYVSYTQVDDVASQFTTMMFSHRVGGLNIGARTVPINKGDNAAAFTGMLKVETRMQAMNATNLQYNEARYYEFCANEISGPLSSTGMHMDGSQDGPFINDTTSIDMTAPQDVLLHVNSSGSGSADSKLVHRFTRVTVIG